MRRGELVALEHDGVIGRERPSVTGPFIANVSPAESAGLWMTSTRSGESAGASAGAGGTGALGASTKLSWGTRRSRLAVRMTRQMNR